MKHPPWALRIATKLGPLAVAGLAVMAIAGPNSASAVGVACASTLDGDPAIPGIQCPNGFEYGKDNPNYSGSVKLQQRACCDFNWDDNVITCNRAVALGRIADSGAADGLPNGFLFDIDWQWRTGGVTSEQCQFVFGDATANLEPIETNTGPGIWDVQWAWITDVDPLNGTMTLLDFKASVNVQPQNVTCFVEGDTDGDGQLNEGDRAVVFDVDNFSGLVYADDGLVESAPQSGSCPDTSNIFGEYRLKGNTDGGGRLNDNLFIREDDA
jgi:hypothetical protein